MDVATSLALIGPGPHPTTSPRIVSLLAAGTELVCELGMGGHLVGRSHECDTPEWVQKLPQVSRPAFDATGRSGAIDAEVRARIASKEPLYEIDESLLGSLAPDVLITQTHCEVCAVTPANLAHGVAAQLTWEKVVALRTGTLEGILHGYAEVARVLGRAASAECRSLTQRLRDGLEAVRAQAADQPRPTVVCLEWIDPLFPMGNWGPELVEVAGGESLLTKPGVHSSAVGWEALRSADPEVLVVAACGFSMQRSISEMPDLASHPLFRELRAVRTGRVFVADGNAYFNRSGPAMFDTVRILAEILHPDVFQPTHEGRIWVQWPAP